MKKYRISVYGLWSGQGTEQLSDYVAARNLMRVNTLCRRYYHCPGALRERDDRGRLNDALEDPDIVTYGSDSAVRTHSHKANQIGL